MQRRTLLKAFALSASVMAIGLSFQAYAADTIKVGIMHSLSGTMAISETPLPVEHAALEQARGEIDKFA
ncbi:hypothetical protein ACLBO4_28805, partial [Klebsiella pneumoniae]